MNHLTIDLDPTGDPTHDARQLTFFNGHYDSRCYLPVAGFVTFNDEPEQYLLAYVPEGCEYVVAMAKKGASGVRLKSVPFGLIRIDRLMLTTKE